MLEKKTKMGRPKNPRIVALENKIARLEDQINELTSKKVSDVNVENLKDLAVGLHKDELTKQFVLSTIKFNPEMKIGKVTESKVIGDSVHLALFELNKFISYEYVLSKRI